MNVNKNASKFDKRIFWKFEVRFECVILRLHRCFSRSSAEVTLHLNTLMLETVNTAVTFTHYIYLNDINFDGMGVR